MCEILMEEFLRSCNLHLPKISFYQKKSMMSFKKKYAYATAALCSTLLLASCGGGDSPGSPSIAKAPAEIVVKTWIKEAPIYDACCNYAQILIDGFDSDAKTHIYTNSAPLVQGAGLHLYQGTLNSVTYKGQVLSITAPTDAYIRTFGMATRDGKYYALLYTGDGYPTEAGFSPSWATSDDGISWKWFGHVSPYPRALSSGQALTAEPDGSFKAWIDQVGGTLREMSSPDGITWKDEGDIWPASLPIGQAFFPNATRTNRGTMISVTDTFPATKIRVLWKCNDQNTWSVLDDNAPILNGEKGTALAWDGVNIHAYSNGSHWIRSEPECAAN